MNRKGFTLTEIMIAISIIFLLLSLSLPGLIRMRQNAEESRIKAELSSIYKAIIVYNSNVGRYPTTWEDLKDYITISNIEEKYQLNTNYGGR